VELKSGVITVPKKYGKPLWVRIRNKGENQSAEARLLAVFEDIKFNEANREG